MSDDRDRTLFEDVEGADQFALLEGRIVDLANKFQAARREKEEMAQLLAEANREVARRDEEIGKLKGTLESLRREREQLYNRVKSLIEKLERIG